MVFRKIATKKEFKNDIKQIIEYLIFDLGHKDAARTLLSEIYSLFERLQSFPELYPVIDNDSKCLRNVRKAPLNIFNVYYEYDKKAEKITVLRIIHGKRKTKSLLELL